MQAFWKIGRLDFSGTPEGSEEVSVQYLQIPFLYHI